MIIDLLGWLVCWVLLVCGFIFCWFCCLYVLQFVVLVICAVGCGLVFSCGLVLLLRVVR